MIRFNNTVSITSITPSQYKNFSCTEPALDEYIKRFAVNQEKIGIGRTFVLLHEQALIGYYTLCAAQISIQDLPQEHRKKIPKYPIPASRLCRLAVGESYQGKKIGEHLLADAIKRVLLADSVMAIHSLIVDAKNEKSKNFYLKYGFIPLEGCDLNLFLSLATLRKSKEYLQMTLSKSFVNVAS